MIVEEFSFPEAQLHYYVGLGSIITTELKLEDAFDLIKRIQNQFNDVTLQLFDKTLILNSKHIFYAIYHCLKSFHLNRNISNNKGIEFLLYLAANRQIKKAIDNFGIKKHHIKHGALNFCIISLNSNLEIIQRDILNEMKAKETTLDLDRLSYDKYENIRKFFAINESQINVVVKANREEVDYKIPNKNNVEGLYLALEDLICEKMAILSLERTPV